MKSSGIKDIDFYGYDSYDAMIDRMNGDYGHDCYEFFYKGEFHQILRDIKGRRRRKITKVVRYSEYITFKNAGQVYEKDAKEYPGHDIRIAFENYVLFDGVKLYDALMNGDIEFN